MGLDLKLANTHGDQAGHNEIECGETTRKIRVEFLEEVFR
jgi:hypothetical protein